MKKRLQEIEEEAGALREMQAKVEKEMGGAQGLINLSFGSWVCVMICCYLVVDYLIYVL